MQEYLWDGIKRDRLVWMGDIYPEMLAIVALFGKNEILEKSLDFACNQSPLPRWINNIPMYSMWWIITCYDYFNHTGDLEFLKTNKNYLEELLDCIDKSIDENGEMNYDPYFLDWPTRYTDDAVTGTRILNTVALQDAIKILNYINADISVAEKCLNKLQQKKIPFSQAKQIIGLKHWLGLQLDPTEKELLIKDGASGISTFMSYFILNAISETAGIETANSIMKEYYGGMLNMGATSFWEDFDISWLKDNPSPIDRLPKDGQKSIHADFGQHCYTGLRHSLCHGWSSGVIYYIFKRILGVKILAPGCRKIELNPNLSSMSFAKGNFPTPYGIITIKCKQENGKLKVVCNAPKEVEIICSM